MDGSIYSHPGFYVMAALGLMMYAVLFELVPIYVSFLSALSMKRKTYRTICILNSIETGIILILATSIDGGNTAWTYIILSAVCFVLVYKIGVSRLKKRGLLVDEGSV